MCTVHDGGTLLSNNNHCALRFVGNGDSLSFRAQHDDVNAPQNVENNKRIFIQPNRFSLTDVTHIEW